MTLKELAQLIENIHIKLYQSKAVKFQKTHPKVYQIIFEDNDSILVDHVVDPRRFRIVFSDYEGKIDAYRDFFDSILGNNVDLCDTGDFLNLSLLEAIKVKEALQ